MLCSFGWNPVLTSAKSKALDLDGKTQRMPLHAPDYTPNPCHKEDDYFRSKWTLGELSNVHHSSWQPHKSACATKSGSILYRKGGGTSYLLLLWDLSRNAPKLLINLLKEGH